MAKPCHSCNEEEHCNPRCPTLRWPDGTLRGSNPGRPPGKTMTLQDELGTIFAGVELVREEPREQGSAG